MCDSEEREKEMYKERNFSYSEVQQLGRPFRGSDVSVLCT